MTDRREVSTQWIINALLNGRQAEQKAAQDAIDDPGTVIDHGGLRARLIEALETELSPARDILESNRAGLRCWFLSALGRVNDPHGDATSVLKKFVSKDHEPNHWAQYWALATLYHKQVDDLQAICQGVKQAQTDRLPEMLAETILAEQGDSQAQHRIRDVLQNPDRDEGITWAVLRALRFVSLPFTVTHVCRILNESVEKDKLGDIPYDAIVTLGNTEVGTTESEEAAETLLHLIRKHRRYQYWDTMRIRALESLGNLKVELSAPLLIEEITDYNPAVSKEAARAFESVLGARTTVSRIQEVLASEGDAKLSRFANAMRFMEDRDSIISALEESLSSTNAQKQECARRLLSELGGALAFDKLLARNKSSEHYLQTLDEADRSLGTMFETTIREAKRGFVAVLSMDIVLFVFGILLLVFSLALAFNADDTFKQWTTVITGGGGLLSTIYGRFLAKPREQVSSAVFELLEFKSVFLGYLRQLRQLDQAYTRRLLDDQPLNTSEVGEFIKMIDETMTKARGAFKRDGGN